MWKYLQNIITPKPLGLGTWNFDTMFAFPYMSCVTCYMSHGTCDVSKIKKKHGGASRSRVCYQRGLPRLVYIHSCLVVNKPYELSWYLYTCEEMFLLSIQSEKLEFACFCLWLRSQMKLCAEGSWVSCQTDSQRSLRKLNTRILNWTKDYLAKNICKLSKFRDYCKAVAGTLHITARIHDITARHSILYSWKADLSASFHKL